MLQLRDLLPPFLYDQLRQSSFRKYGWFGDYENWQAAKNASTGYDADLIIEKVLHATLQVKEGKFPYERDSVLFDEIQYDWPLLASLMWVAAKSQGQLRTLDFGGSLGSTYWQNRRFLDTLPGLSWNIVEQEKYFLAGKKHLENSVLRFYPDVTSCVAEAKPNLVLVSSVLNYMEEPYTLLKSLCNLRTDYLILERIPFIEAGKDRLTVQRVSPKIYQASYPAWFFDRKKFFSFIESTHDVLEVFDCGIKLNLPSQLQGLILTPKKHKS